MRLINCSTLRLEEFFGSKIPRYAILSHMWGDEEVSFADFTLDQAVKKRAIKKREGYQKILFTCKQALEDGLRYAWVDTCCIDKTSSAELSEAINSMFRWYMESSVCYVYLEDVAAELELSDPSNSPDVGFMGAFQESRWFQRGWTLQELLAPKHVRFFSNSWVQIGTRRSLHDTISSITGIPPDVLAERKVQKASVAQRMAWAAGRKTTRKEDMAYCLLGMFDVNMPLLYGEGGQKAFRRLQEEIIKQSNDQSIFAWGFGLPNERQPSTSSILAALPSDFAGCKDVVPCEAWKPVQVTHFEITKKGLHIELPFVYVSKHNIRAGPFGAYDGVLNCRLTHDFQHLIAIPLHAQFLRDGADLVIQRKSGQAPSLIEERKLQISHLQDVYITGESSEELSKALLSFSSALVQRSQNIRFEKLDIDGSLTIVFRQQHVHICLAPVDLDLVIRLPFVYPDFPKKAYLGCWLDHIPLDSPFGYDFLVRVEFLRRERSSWASVLMRKKLPNCIIQCDIAKASVQPSESQWTAESLKDLRWSKSMISGNRKIRVHTEKRTTLGSPMSIITFETASRNQLPHTRIISYHLPKYTAKIWVFLQGLLGRATVAVEGGPLAEALLKLLWISLYSLSGLSFLLVSIFIPFLPLERDRGLWGSIFVSSSCWLALGIASISTYFPSSSPS